MQVCTTSPSSQKPAAVTEVQIFVEAPYQKFVVKISTLYNVNKSFNFGQVIKNRASSSYSSSSSSFLLFFIRKMPLKVQMVPPPQPQMERANPISASNGGIDFGQKKQSEKEAARRNAERSVQGLGKDSCPFPCCSCCEFSAFPCCCCVTFGIDDATDTVGYTRVTKLNWCCTNTHKYWSGFCCCRWSDYENPGACSCPQVHYWLCDDQTAPEKGQQQIYLMAQLPCLYGGFALGLIFVILNFPVWLCFGPVCFDECQGGKCIPNECGCDREYVHVAPN